MSCDRRRNVKHVESLESRQLLSVTMLDPLPDVSVAPAAGNTTIDLKTYIDDPNSTGKVVRFATSQGNLNVWLYDKSAPATAANFLQYVNDGRYDDTFFHRSVPGFVVQGGGYAYPGFGSIDKFAPVVNEYSSNRPNDRGTVAMAKAAGNPNSATSEFFVNIDDNTDLNSQNGGFTVFGELIDNTLNTADTVNALPRGDFSPTLPFDELPLVNYPGSGLLPTDANLVMVDGVSVQSRPVVYAVSSSNPSVAGVSLDGSQLTIDYGNIPGAATITVTATDASGNKVQDAFAVGVGATSVVVGKGANKQVTFVEDDGTKASVTVGGNGTATVQILGDNITQVEKSGTVTVSGNNLSLAAITTSDTDAASKLNINGSGGDGYVNLGSVTASSPLSQVNAKKARLLGDMNLASVAKVQLGPIVGGAVSHADAARVMQFQATDVADGEFASLSRVKSFKANQWVDLDGVQDTIAAMGMDSLEVKNAFSAELDLSGGGTALGKAKVGDVGGRTWSVGGDVGTVNILSTASGWNALIDGAVSKFQVKNDMSGGLFARSAKTIQAGTFTDLRIDLSDTVAEGVYALNDLKAKTASNTQIRTQGNINSVQFQQGMLNSTLFAGVDDFTPVPDQAGDFVTNATINKVNIQNNPAAGHSFIDSGIAASRINQFNMANTPDLPASAPFYGVSAASIGKFQAQISGTTVKTGTLDSQAAADLELANDGVTPSNFRLVIV